MVKCVVENCENDTRKHTKKKFNITFHRFPKDQNLTKKWLEILDKSDWEPSIWSKICSKHFPDSSLFDTRNGLRKLTYDAVPSLFLNNPHTCDYTSTNIEEAPNPSTSEATGAPRKRTLKQEVVRLNDLAKRRRLRCNTLYAALRRLRQKLNNMTQVIKELKKEKSESLERAFQAAPVDLPPNEITFTAEPVDLQSNEIAFTTAIIYFETTDQMAGIIS